MAQTLKQRKPKQRITQPSDSLPPQLPERPAVTEALLADIIQRIVEAYDPEKVILFGCYAYGTPHKDGDIDLFVVMKRGDESSAGHESACCGKNSFPNLWT